MQGKKLLSEVSEKTDEHEFYTPIPEGYEIGKTKYVFVFGTVMSGIGKGILSSSLAKLIKDKGFKVSPMKFDGYLNVDAGTLNPFRHGEVFVLDDGLETDMDLGSYERILDIDLSADNYLTGGKILSNVLKQERKGGYLGRDVQFIPHVTGFIKEFFRKLALKSRADIVFIEVGGTVGDIENGYFIEAVRQFAYEEGKKNVCFMAMTYVVEPKFLGEQKSKAAQLGIRSLLSAGIQPDVIACRAHNKVSRKVREKISIYSNVPVENVVSLHDCQTIYEVPEILKKEKIDIAVLNALGLKDRKGEKEEEEYEKLKSYILSLKSAKKELLIGITGKYTGLRDSYASIIKALEHASVENNVRAKIKWIETTEIEEGKLSVDEALKDVDGIIVPGGFGKRGVEGKIMCIKYARENNLPYFGLCYGFQMALIEFARNVCGLKGANTTEVDPDTKYPVVDILPEQKKIEGLGGNMRLGGYDVLVKKGTRAYEIYGAEIVRERFRHRFECNPDYISIFEKNGLVFSGKAPNYDIMQIVEIPEHRFFIGVQFHPEFTSRLFKPNKLYLAFIKACLEKG